MVDACGYLIWKCLEVFLSGFPSAFFFLIFSKPHLHFATSSLTQIRFMSNHERPQHQNKHKGGKTGVISCMVGGMVGWAGLG